MKSIGAWLREKIPALAADFFGLLWFLLKKYWYILLILIAVVAIAFALHALFEKLMEIRDERWLQKYESSKIPDDKKLEKVAREVASRFNRVVYIGCYQLMVHAEISSQTGNSTWNCHIDFNDNGKLTGRFVVHIK